MTMLCYKLTYLPTLLTTFVCELLSDMLCSQVHTLCRSSNILQDPIESQAHHYVETQGSSNWHNPLRDLRELPVEAGSVSPQHLAHQSETR